MNKIRINQGRVLSIYYRLAFSLVIFFVILVLMSELSEFPAISLSILISLLLPPIWSAYYVITIDLTDQLIIDGIWVAGLKRENKHAFNALTKIFVNVVNTSQAMTSYGGHVHTKKNREFHAYLKTDDDKKFFLLSGKTKVELLQKLDPLAQKLGIEISDNTG